MVVSVDDSKDERFKSRLFEPATDGDTKKAAPKPAAKKTTTASSDKK
jgi:hypothetical protein